ncbi:co-chaperone GroES [Candidatus Azambacteria bacterium]|nr:co-chaperone GroES [Candidatus Azambacteria bacterium]MBI2587743.1 co-chaperone GroES [Candidatus Azambacteria bacterium]
MQIRPLSDHILLEAIQETTTPSGIVIPETAKEKPIEGRVIAVGPGRVTDEGRVVPMSVKVGDRVLFKKYGPDEVRVGDKEYLIAKEEDILAVIE